MDTLLLVGGYLVCAFIGLLSVILLWFIWIDKINICGILSEANGQASMARFQLLFFTLVVGISFFELVEKNNGFPDMSGGVLTLLGISASTYAVGKGISYSREEGVTSPKERSDALDKKHAAAKVAAVAAASAPAPEQVVVAEQAVIQNAPQAPQA
jgi:hypothetical protein